MISKYHHNYSPADESLLLHADDPDLTPIRISLPKPPSLELIAGYGEKPIDQRFAKLELPSKLKKLEQECIKALEQRSDDNKQFVITRYKLQKEFWNRLETNRIIYSEEIDFIKRIWWHRIHGYWFFNRGKPTYISGWHFMYLNFWYMPDVKGGYPEYRDRDRKEFLFHLYAYTTTETFKNLGDDGFAIPNKDGSYDMIDTGVRICYGLGQSKNRRSGNTNKGLNNIIEIVTRTIGTDGVGIMSYTGGHAEDQFKKKLMLAWNRWPIFLMPLTQTNSLQSNSLIFDVKGGDFGIDGLQTGVTYGGSSDAKAYDGKKLMGVLIDESGKTTETDTDERWKVTQHCLAQGNGALIHGYAYHPSTVEEYSSGGEAYKRMMEKSCFYQRIEVSSQTPSGLFRLFIPGDEALDRFIDSYGYSVREKLLDYQREEGFTQTATEYLQGVRDYFFNLGTPEAKADYRTQQKLFPLKYADSWLGEAGDIGFDLEIIDTRIIELNRKSETVRGNFEWTNGFHSDVEWVADEENGRFNVSRLFTDRANKRVKETVFDYIDQQDMDTWAPLDPDFATASGDPFKFKSSTEVKKSYAKHGMSDGGFVVTWDYDEQLDRGKPRSEWDSDDIICTYRFRPATDDEYCEDTLKACIWYGALMYPEMNIALIYKKYREWGYMGYLKYDVSPDGVVKQEPGVHMMTGAKQEGFSLARNYVQYRGHRIKHLDLLMEMKNIQSIEDLTNYDLLASFLVNRLGSRSKYSKVIKQFGEMNIDISGIVQMTNY